MNITRYIDTMKRMLSSNIQGDVQYKPLPTNITLYEGTLDQILDSVENNIMVKLNMKCEKVTEQEDVITAGRITLTGISRLGKATLSFQEILSSFC